MTPVQALIQQLGRRDHWFMRLNKNTRAEQVEHLFFARKSWQLCLELNPEVLVMDATYKKNKYKLPLLVVTGVTALNTSFYVTFALMKAETTDEYIWVLR